MIVRIRVSGIRPNTLDQFREAARDWRNLLEKHGGRVLGFYFNETENKVTGVAEYESKARLGGPSRRGSLRGIEPGCLSEGLRRAAQLSARSARKHE